MPAGSQGPTRGSRDTAPDQPRRSRWSDVDDPLALPPGDPSPIVGVRGIREILVLLELLTYRLEHVHGLDAVLPAFEESFDRLPLGPRHDVLEHRATCEILEVEDLALALGVGDLEEFVVLSRRVHIIDDVVDHLRAGLAAIVAVALQELLVER
jgi:hypothetical protein